MYDWNRNILPKTRLGPRAVSSNPFHTHILGLPIKIRMVAGFETASSQETPLSTSLNSFATDVVALPATIRAPKQ